MKRTLLIIATAALVGQFVQANVNTVKNTITTNQIEYNNRGEFFTFVEGNITFAIYQNGEFDFYINPQNGTSVNYNSSNLNISFNAGYNYDTYVQYDDYGAVIQIENIPIYYDYYGRVTRIGNVNINYSNGRLARLGGMRIYYDNYGNYIRYAGYVNVYNRTYVYLPFFRFFTRPHFEYRVISYRPYRQHYYPTRYVYRDGYYFNNRNKHVIYKTRSRIATERIPDRYRNDDSHFNMISRSNYNRFDTHRNKNEDRNQNYLNSQRSNSTNVTTHSAEITHRPNRNISTDRNTTGSRRTQQNENSVTERNIIVPHRAPETRTERLQANKTVQKNLTSTRNNSGNHTNKAEKDVKKRTTKNSESTRNRRG